MVELRVVQRFSMWGRGVAAATRASAHRGFRVKRLPRAHSVLKVEGLRVRCNREPVRERERARERVCVECVRERVCVCERERERECVC